MSRWDEIWQRSLHAARLLQKSRAGESLTIGERQLAQQLAQDASVTNRLIAQAIDYLRFSRNSVGE